jgi:hypothetical protein
MLDGVSLDQLRTFRNKSYPASGLGISLPTSNIYARHNERSLRV